jgi:hypothetical protein
MYKTPNVRRRVFIILGITLVFMAGLGAFLFWYLGGQEKAATTQAKKFIAALEKHDPAAAPPKGDDYVRGIWRTYRSVDSAELVDTHQKHHRDRNSDSGYSWWVADMLLHTGRGLAVVELAFEPNHLDPKTQIIDAMYELTPERVPGGVVSSATLARVRSDQRERGLEPADDFKLAGTFGKPPAKPGRTPPSSKPAKPHKTELPPALKCVKAAHGDVNKLKKCAEAMPQP